MMRSNRAGQWLPWIAGVAALAVLGVAALRLYSPAGPWDDYAAATRRFISLGVSGDSAALAARSAGAEPSAWVLAARRQNPAMLRSWSRGLRVRAGRRIADTVMVNLQTNAAPGCPGRSRLTAEFLETGGTRRVLSLQSPCVKGFGAHQRE